MSDNFSRLPAHLNPNFASMLLSIVDTVGHRMSYDDLCKHVGFEPTPKNKGILAMYSEGLEEIDICDSPKGRSGFGRKGMKNAEGLKVTAEDLSPDFLKSADIKLRNLHNSGQFSFSSGVPVAVVCALFQDKRDRLLVRLALERKVMQGFKVQGGTVKLA